jgi:type II pantothenate kinase
MAVGVDVGATLAKIAVRGRDGVLHFHLEAAEDFDAVVRRVEEARPERVGLTGGGAAELGRRLAGAAAQVNEFAAWGAGAAALLRRDGTSSERHLLVSLGTGTSVMLADGMAVTRIGGTALGGGTIVGLGSALLGTDRFTEIAELAARGTRRQVDLLVSDIYRAGEIPLAGELTAANFGKLAKRRQEGSPAPEDVAAALMGLVGENVALVCAGLAAASQVRRIVFAGSTLRSNRSLVEVLRQITLLLGREPTFLQDGEFAGAYGALLLASA